MIVKNIRHCNLKIFYEKGKNPTQGSYYINVRPWEIVEFNEKFVDSEKLNKRIAQGDFKVLQDQNMSRFELMEL